MKFILAIVAVASAYKLTHRKADLPYDLEADKIDPVSRYVNDDDLIMIHKGDLPYNLEADKIDPLSRYVNDDDIVQVDDDLNMVQLNSDVNVEKDDLPHDLEADKIDPVSRYVNDDDI